MADVYAPEDDVKVRREEKKKKEGGYDEGNHDRRSKRTTMEVEVEMEEGRSD